MPECQNCGSHVSDQYVRVSVPEHLEAPRTCPHCPDAVSEGKRHLSGPTVAADGGGRDGL